ncbi:MAG: DUF3137 domain-containing protein [Candidatus Marinarcus sp.]|uniref:DUF3137 domain-containing protein n=1 Tax=Candidatus Marinarcus sp. TaxID=3100987 RepID=UPI003B004826
MKTVEELKEFYYSTLSVTLKKLESERENVKQRVILIFLPLTLIYFSFIFYFYDEITKKEDALNWIVMLYAVLAGALYKFLIKDYRKSFKNKVIQPLIEAIHEGFIYIEDSHISEKIFNRSDLFSIPHVITGNDYVSGLVEGVKLQFSDLHAQKIKRSGKNVHHETIFQGLFILAEFNKIFKGKTLVLPDQAQSLFGDLIGGWLQSNNINRDELVKLDNIEFEKNFVVYSTDQIEARYILTPALMERLLDFKRRLNHPIYISFIDDYIHVAVYSNKDMFEPTVFTSLLDYEVALEYIHHLHLAMGIVYELKLNEMLWSKKPTEALMFDIPIMDKKPLINIFK